MRHFNTLLKGGASGAGLLLLLLVVFVFSFAMVFGGANYPIGNTLNEGPTGAAKTKQIIITTTPEPGQDNLQIKTFNIITTTPLPVPQNSNACVSNPFNEEPDIFLASDPPSGGIAAAGSQIKVWVDDGNGGSVAPDSVIDQNTGRIITPGDRSASDGKGPGYYLWEPALYLTPVSSPTQPGPYSGDAENGGRPYFPQIVKGEASLADTGNRTGFLRLPPIDTPVNVVAGRKGHGGHIAEYIWDVNSLGLASGTGYYRVQIVVHDGDGDLAINCTTIQL